MNIFQTFSPSRSTWRLAALMALLAAVLLLPSIAQAQSPSLTATRNADWSVDLNMSNGPSNWWFRINSWGTCTPASGTTVNNIRGYGAGTHSVWAYSDGSCGTHIATSSFTIPNASVAATVNDDRSVTLTLTNGPANWWFFIGYGTCTPASGTTVSNIRGYQANVYSIGVTTDSSCEYLIAHTEFTIPSAALATTVNSDRSVDLTLTGGPSNWWFKIGGGTCTAASGTTVSNIRGYQSGVYGVNAYSDGGCSYHIASSSFTIPAASLATTVNGDRSVDLTLTGGPGNWWFRINSWGTCTAASGTTVSNIRGYAAGTHHVWAYSDSGCGYHIASSSFTLAPLVLPAAPASVVGYRGNGFIDVEWTSVSGATSYDVDIRHENATHPSRAASGVTGTSFKITGLANLGRFYVYARANNANGGGPWTASERVPVGMTPIQPSAITTSRTATTFTVSWTSCDMSEDWCNGYTPVTGYFVEVSSDNGATWTRAHTLTTYTQNQALTISNADASKDYKVRVKIENRMGGVWKYKDAPALPSAPEFFNVTSATSGSAVTDTLKWNKPSDASGAVGYEVQCQYTNDSTWTSCKTVAPTTAANVTTTVTSTTANKVTALRARANESGSLGAWASPIPDPTSFLAQYQDSELLMWWERPTGSGTAALSYEVDCSSDSGATYMDCQPVITSPTAGDNTFEAKLTTTGITNLRLRWTDGETTVVQHGGWVFTSVPTHTPPGAPTNIQRTREGTLAITYTITWDKPSGETRAVGYEVQCTRANNSAWGSCTTVTGNVDRDLVDATTDSSLTLTATTGPYSELRKVRVRATYELRIASDWTTRTTW